MDLAGELPAEDRVQPSLLGQAVLFGRGRFSGNQASEQVALHGLNKEAQEFVCVFLSARPHLLRDPSQLGHDRCRRNRGALRGRGGVQEGHMLLHGANQTEAFHHALPSVLSRQEPVRQGRRIRKTLQDRVEEAGVAQVVQPRPNTANFFPFQQAHHFVLGRLFLVVIFWRW